MIGTWDNVTVRDNYYMPMDPYRKECGRIIISMVTEKNNGTMVPSTRECMRMVVNVDSENIFGLMKVHTRDTSTTICSKVRAFIDG